MFGLWREARGSADWGLGTFPQGPRGRFASALWEAVVCVGMGMFAVVCGEVGVFAVFCLLSFSL